MSQTKHVGILALQGDFSNHLEKLTELGAKCLLVKNPSELSAVDALVIPGGESSAMLKLMDEEFREALKSSIESGLPTLATCAGVILLAKRVENPSQESLGVLDVTATRNGYGRQVDSSIVELELSEVGKKLFSETHAEGVFIRAPVVSEIGSEVEVLSYKEKDPVLLRQNNIWAATFHPELGERQSLVHKQFLLSGS